jgi:hypothetical protein
MGQCVGVHAKSTLRMLIARHLPVFQPSPLWNLTYRPKIRAASTASGSAGTCNGHNSLPCSMWACGGRGGWKRLHLLQRGCSCAAAGVPDGAGPSTRHHLAAFTEPSSAPEHGAPQSRGKRKPDLDAMPGPPIAGPPVKAPQLITPDSLAATLDTFPHYLGEVSGCHRSDPSPPTKISHLPHCLRQHIDPLPGSQALASPSLSS